MLNILDNLPTQTIRAVLLNYSEAMNMIYKAYQVRFSLRCLSEDYYRINNVINEMAFNDEPTEYLINITDITKNGVEDLLSWSIRYVYENTENTAEFINELQSRRYCSLHPNIRDNFTEISYEELLTKLEERI